MEPPHLGCYVLLEVSPQEASLRDLGSLNGTSVNGKKFSGRELDETPEQGAARKHPIMTLHDGDEVRVGQTALKVRIEPRNRPSGGSAQVREELARLIFEVKASPGKKAERLIKQQISGLPH